MHDITAIEGQGLPAVFVASNAFTDAAEAQSRALGSAPLGVFVTHPIQDRTDDELHALAEGALEPIVEALTRES